MEDPKEPVFTWQDLNDNPPPSRKMIWLRVGEEAFVGSRIVYKDEWSFFRGKKRNKDVVVYRHANRQPMKEPPTQWCSIAGPWVVQKLIDRHNKLKDIENEQEQGN